MHVSMCILKICYKGLQIGNLKSSCTHTHTHTQASTPVHRSIFMHVRPALKSKKKIPTSRKMYGHVSLLTHTYPFRHLEIFAWAK